MRKISDIRNSLQQGDNQVIAELTGLTEDYVSKVLNEKRNNSEVIRVAKEIIANREKFIKEQKELLAN